MAYAAEKQLHKLVQGLGFELGPEDRHHETQSASYEYKAVYGGLRCRFIEWGNVNMPTADMYTEGGENIVSFVFTGQGWAVRNNRTAEWVLGQI
jgi:hypothetical protein